jgi:hypothetical protein
VKPTPVIRESVAQQVTLGTQGVEDNDMSNSIEVKSTKNNDLL